MKKVICIGLDGLDPAIAEALLAAGELPNLARLRSKGCYARLATTTPAQTPVAWSTFATGVNPGVHGIFDFLRRDPSAYRPELSLFGFERPNRFLPPRPVSRRGGEAIWETLTDVGIPSRVLRHPVTFPPARSIRGRMLAGVGVPDLRGGFGTATVFTSGDLGPAGEGEEVVGIEPRGGVARAAVLGPRGRSGPMEAGLLLTFDSGSRRVSVEAEEGGDAVVVREGKWSDWLELRFSAGLLQTVRGRMRFYLTSAREPYLLYGSPVNLDPRVPQHPVSEPWDYADELDRAIGPFHTLGMAEDHNGLNNGRLSEEAYLTQCAAVRNERLAMMHYELERHDEGFFYCLFDTPDRVQHMFWRYRESDHPSNRVHTLDPALERTIEDEYRACDRVVGEALEYADEETLFLVVSDHGFASYQREVHLNRWLLEQGYLVLDSRAAGDADGAFDSTHVDWGRTRAYALGLVGIYLNLEGREGSGVVAPEDAGELARTIAGELAGLPDAERGATAVRSVSHRDEVYRGARVGDAPDLIVKCAPGHRISSATALGGVPPTVLSDNVRRWSGDHVVDPAAVPGVLFAGRPLDTASPSILDLAPTILSALDVPVPDSHEGRSLLP